MTDNVTASAGTADGATFATDDDGTAHHPYVKLEFGADNTQTKVSTSSPLPVTLANTGANATAVKVDGSAVTQPVSASALPLPTGAATSAKQPALGTAGSASSDVITVQGVASMTALKVDGSAVTQPVSGTVTVNALPAGTNNIGDVDIASIAAGSNLIGDVGIGVRTSGGSTPYKNLDVDETEDQVKGTAGQVYWIHAINLATAVRYLKFYNATAANVTVGTTTPVLTFPIPTQAETADGAGFVLSIPNGIAFDTAITIAATTGIADSDTGAPGTNEVIVNLGYK